MTTEQATEQRAMYEAKVAEFSVVHTEHAGLAKRLATLKGQLKDYMEAEGVNRLEDPESGAAVVRKVGMGSSKVDVVHMSPEIVAELHTFAVLTANVGDLKRIAGKSLLADQAQEFIMPGGERVSLELE